MIRQINGEILDVIRETSGIHLVLFDGSWCHGKSEYRKRFVEISEASCWDLNSTQSKRGRHELSLHSDISNRQIRHFFYHCSVDDDDDASAFVVDSLGATKLPVLVAFVNGEVDKTIDWTNDMEVHEYMAEYPEVYCKSEDHLSKYNHETFCYHIKPRYHISLNTNDGDNGNEKQKYQAKVIKDMIGSDVNMKLFVSGDRASVGKSTTCLSIIAALKEIGIKSDDIAYIKPVTQCEQPQPITDYCTQQGIVNRGIGPVVFYKGFTRAYLDGLTDSSDVMLRNIRTAVDEISYNKSFTLIDGVGYPAVGSICNLSNAHVAQHLQVPVLLIGKSGVGDAVDSHNLNCSYFESRGVSVLGAIFNKLSLDGYYSLQNCKEAVSQYFKQFLPYQDCYGFIPSVVTINSDSNVDGTHNGNKMEIDSQNDNDKDIELTSRANTFGKLFLEYVEILNLFEDCFMDAIPFISENEFLGKDVAQEMQSGLSQFGTHNKEETCQVTESTTTFTEARNDDSAWKAKKLSVNNDPPTATIDTNVNGAENGELITAGTEAAPMVRTFNPKKRKLTREDIENGATLQGAAGG